MLAALRTSKNSWEAAAPGLGGPQQRGVHPAPGLCVWEGRDSAVVTAATDFQVPQSPSPKGRGGLQGMSLLCAQFGPIPDLPLKQVRP